MQGVPGKLRKLFGGFGESKLVQFRIDFNRLHSIIIPSVMEAELDLARSLSRSGLIHESEQPLRGIVNGAPEAKWKSWDVAYQGEHIGYP